MNRTKPQAAQRSPAASKRNARKPVRARAETLSQQADLDEALGTLDDATYLLRLMPGCKPQAIHLSVKHPHMLRLGANPVYLTKTGRHLVARTVRTVRAAGVRCLLTFQWMGAAHARPPEQLNFREFLQFLAAA